MSDWVTVSVAAEMLGVQSSQVRRLCAKGALVCEKAGAYWIVNTKSIGAYAQSDRKPGPKPTYQGAFGEKAVLNEAEKAYEVPETREIIIRLETRHIDYLLATYGSVPDGILAIINAKMQD